MGVRRGLGTLVIAALVLFAAPAKAAVKLPVPGPLDNATDLAEAQRLEHLMDQHIYNGQVYEIEYRDATRTFGQVAQLTDFTDSALWTGTYLASQAYRYQVAKYKLLPRNRHLLTDEERAFWEGEKAAAMARAVPLAKQYHVLSNISGQWKAGGDLNPSFTPPSDPTDPQSTQLSLGRGLIDSEPGLLFRACIPDNAPAWQQWPYPRRASVFGPFTFEGVTYHCEDATSRDAYAGATFGMVTAFDFNNDLGGPYSPLFLYTPLARLNLAQIARHVATVLGDTVETAKWNAVWAEELALTGPAVGPSELQNAAEPDSSYYKFNLEWLTGFDAMRLEPNAAARKLLGAGMAVMEATTGDDVNAHFETLSYALTGSQERLAKAVTHLREWRAWRAQYEGLDQSKLNSDRCDIPGGLTCIARADVNVYLGVPGLPPVFVPDPQTASGYTPKNCHEPNRYSRDNCRSATVLPVADRVPTDFLWQRSPFQLDADRSPLHESQGIDYLLPYWMLRYYTEVAPPANAPFPTYTGPSFS
jgi:hypothetical protein